jgi:hypothetical protein
MRQQVTAREQIKRGNAFLTLIVARHTGLAALHGWIVDRGPQRQTAHGSESTRSTLLSDGCRDGLRQSVLTVGL